MRPDTPPDSRAETAKVTSVDPKVAFTAPFVAPGDEVVARTSSGGVDLKVNTASHEAPAAILKDYPDVQPFPPSPYVPPAQRGAAPPARVEKAGNVFDSGQVDAIVKRLPVAATADIGAPAQSEAPLFTLGVDGRPVARLAHPEDCAPILYDHETLVKADKLTLVISAEKDGKLRLNAASWENGKVILPGEELDVRWIGGQVALVRRKPKAGA